jgi:hypothetical protein
MANIKRANASSITKSGVAIADVPDAPTIGAVAALTDGTVTVAFTPAITGGAVTTFTATSTPGSITGTSATSPITVSGLSLGTDYTFTVTGTNSTGTGPASAASSSVSPTALAYDSIATTTLGSTQATISFTSIPSTYTHLQIRFFAKCSTAGGGVPGRMRFNSDTGSNYSYHYLVGNGVSALSGGAATQTAAYIGTITDSGSGGAPLTFSTGIIDILDYANTNKNTTIRQFGNYDDNGGGQLGLYSSLWQNTAAVSRIDLTVDSTTFSQYTKFALYGMKG